jgi:C4-dicarboxylate transporter, DctM subunit
MVNFGLSIGLFALLTGTPIFLAFVLWAGFPLHFGMGIPLSAIANLCVGGMDKYVLLAIPMFILAGNLMVITGVAKRLVDLFVSFIGHINGGMPVVVVVTCAFFGACSGSSLAIQVAVGSIMIPMMKEQGYQPSFTAGLVAVAAMIGMLIPPSNGLIITGAITGTSVSKLFMAGVVPGLLMTLTFSVYAFIVGRRQNNSVIRFTTQQRKRAVIESLPSLSIPVVVLGGIYTGMFTPTEAASVACFVAVTIGLIHHSLSWQGMATSLKKAATSTAMIYLLICTAVLLSAMFSYVKIPQNITAWATGSDVGLPMFILVMSLVLVVLGTLIEAVPGAYISFPVLFPVAIALGMDPLVFGVLAMAMMGAGNITPPVGVALYTAAAISKEPVPKVLKACLPLWFQWIAVLLLMAYFPKIATYLPSLMSAN